MTTDNFKRALSNEELLARKKELEAPVCEEVIRNRKSEGARLGHIKRRLKQNEPLTGKTLELALEYVEAGSEIERKLIAGETLSEYEYHIFVEVILLHARLG